MKKNNKKGFTLVELVIVVAVMAILVAVAIPVVSTITESEEDGVISATFSVRCAYNVPEVEGEAAPATAE